MIMSHFGRQSARETSFELITFLKGYYSVAAGKNSDQAIEVVKECQEAWNKAVNDGHLYDAPVYYAIIARLFHYLYVAFKDPEEWGSALFALVHATLYGYLEAMAASYLAPTPALDIAIHDTTQNLRTEDLRGTDQVWHVSIFVPNKHDYKREFYIERRGNAFTIVEEEYS